MKGKPELMLVLVLLMLLLASGQVVHAETGKNMYVKNVENRLLSGAEALPTGNAIASNLGASRSPGTMIGETYYDYQHNGSMGRQIVFTYEGTDDYAGVHMIWMCLPCEGGFRHIRYNARDFTGVWAWDIGPGGGKAVTGENGGYPSIDVSHRGACVLGYHSGPYSDLYTSKVAMDHNAPQGYFDPYGEAPGPPNCDGWITGEYEATSIYIWPKVEYDECAEDTVFHLVASEHEIPYAGDEIRTMVYWKGVWDDMGAGQPVFPACATAIDSVYDLTVVVRQDPTSDEVAIVWGKPIHYHGDPDDPCSFIYWQNDVYVWKSFDCGDNFLPDNKINVTDYTVGGTVPIDQVTQLMFTDLSALYDHNGVLHVVWNTPLRDGCDPQFASRIWHWDDSPTGCITIAYDASRPRFMMSPGASNSSTCKMNVSECDDKLYCSFTRFGFHTSANGDTSVDASAGGYENGDIGLVASSDGGKTWSEAVNLTNTQTDECAPGDCESEHWSSMAKYSYDSVYIEYIEDRDAGGMPVLINEGEITCNPVRFIAHPCFTVEPYCALAYTPVEVGYPLHIAPNDGSGDCTSGLTTTFTLRLDNIGTQSTDYTVTSNQPWLTPGTSGGALNAGCGGSVDITYTIGPIATEGVYDAQLDISACGGAFNATINVRVFAYCKFYLPEYEILSTACWAIGLWNTPRAGIAHRGEEGNMYWFLEDFPVMYDESIIITYAGETCKTWFSVFDGSNSNVDLVPLSYLTTAAFSNYEYAHALFANGDTTIIGEIEYYLPNHQDTCVLIEHFSLCNNADTTVEIHVGLAIDWDIPDGAGGYTNRCGKDESREMLYQMGPVGGPEENYYGGASFYHVIPGAIVLQNDEWVYANFGFYPCEIGQLLATHTGFSAECVEIEDYNSVYVISQNLVLEPDECITHCNVKTSTLNGLAELQELIDKGKEWKDCPQPPVELCPDFESSARTTGGLKVGTKVRNRFRIYQSAFDPEANSLSFKISQKEPWIFVNGWSIKVCNFENATSTRVDTHTVSVSASGGTIAYGDNIEVDVTLYLTSWNSVRVSDVLWGNTFRTENGSTITETVKACPDFGWVIEAPAPKDGDTIEHSIILYNDDEDETFAFTDIGLLLSDEYVDIISEVPEYPDSLESDTLGPGESMTDTLTEVPCIVGDADGSGEVDIDDVVFLISFIFSGGPPPSPYGSGDANCSGGENAIDIDDVVYLIAYIFSGGEAPGLTCTCYGTERRSGGAGHIYGTFKIESGRGDVVVINWIDHPTD